MKLTTLPPMVREKQTPETIMFAIMGPSDTDAMVKFLSVYQKTRPEWDVYRHKIPDALLDKFARVLQECRASGYINPRVQGEKIVWWQILGQKRNYKHANQCTLCSRNFVTSDCRGKLKIIDNKQTFVFCWN